MAKKAARISEESASAPAPAAEEKTSRKARQPAMTAEEMDAYADTFYEFAMAAYENMREGVRILKLCEDGTTVKPQSTNTMRMIRKVAGSSTDFVTKSAKAARDQGKDPRPKIR